MCTDCEPKDRTYPKDQATRVDLDYAIRTLLAAGAVVEHRGREVTGPHATAAHAQRVDFADERYWSIHVKGRTSPIVVTGWAMLELAHTEARRKRQEWQQAEDTLQLALFAREDTPNYKVTR